MCVYEQPPRRRISPILAVVLVLLAGAVGAVAYVVTRQIVAGDPVADGPGTTGTPSSSNASTAPTNGPDPNTCPALTEAAVKAKGLAGGLKLLLYVSAKGTDTLAGAEAWVCQNTDGLLIYQGHRRTGAFTDVCCADTILLAAGIKGRVVQVGNSFVATSPKDVSNPDDPNHTDYHVSRTEFYFVDLPQNTTVTYSIDKTGP
jgi:hypothetical protein